MIVCHVSRPDGCWWVPHPCDSVNGHFARFRFVWSVSCWSIYSVMRQISGAPRWQWWVCFLGTNEVPVPPGHGAKVGQGVLFAVVCNCTHLNSHSAPPPLLSQPPLFTHAHHADHLVAPGILSTIQREQDWPVTIERQHLGSNQVNKRQTAVIPALSLITHHSLGLHSMCIQTTQQSGSK